MNKPALATLGVVGACAVCCSIPLVIPVMTGLSVAGLVSVDGGFMSGGAQMLAVGAGLAVALLMSGGIWWHRRQTATRCGQTQGAATVGSGSGCGAAQGSSKETK